VRCAIVLSTCSNSAKWKLEIVRPNAELGTGAVSLRVSSVSPYWSAFRHCTILTELVDLAVTL
jgi:hypothetical protein